MTTGREIYQLPHRIAILHNHFVTGGATRNRTGVHGFAGRCITTLPSRHDRFGRLPLSFRSLRIRHLPDRRILGAGNESRTRDLNLGKVALYQLSYSRFDDRARNISTSAPHRNTAQPLCYWRRDSESNRGTRLCRPLHNHSAIAPRPFRPVAPELPEPPDQASA